MGVFMFLLFEDSIEEQDDGNSRNYSEGDLDCAVRSFALDFAGTGVDEELVDLAVISVCAKPYG